MRQFLDKLEEISEDPDKAKLYNPNAQKNIVSKDGSTASSPLSPSDAQAGWAGWMASSAVNLTMAAARHC